MSSTYKATASTTDDQIVVSVEHTARAGDKHIVLSGHVENTRGGSVASSSAGSTDDIVLGVLATSENRSTPAAVSTSLSKLCIVPKNISHQEACTYTAALLSAVAAVQQEFRMKMTSSHRRPDPRIAKSPSSRRIVVDGGETPLGAALTQVLVRMKPDARVVLLSSMSDQQELFQRTSHLTGLGAWYAIDGAIPDLLEYAGLKEKDGVEIILNAREGVRVREDLGKVGRVVECGEPDQDVVRGELDLENAGFFGLVFDMLREAADVMAVYIEPPDSCGFADDDD